MFDDCNLIIRDISSVLTPSDKRPVAASSASGHALSGDKHNMLTHSQQTVLKISSDPYHNKNNTLTYSLTHNKLSSKYLVIGDKNNTLTHSINQSLTHSKLLKMSGYRGQPQHTHSQQTVLKTSSDGTTHMLYIRTNTKHTNSLTENQNFQCNFG